MFRKTLAALAAVFLIGASLTPNDAFARRGGGGGFRGGGYHGGGAHFRGEWRGLALPVGDTADTRDAAMDIVQYLASLARRSPRRRLSWGPGRRPAPRRWEHTATTAAITTGCYLDANGYRVCPQPYPY